LNQRRFQPRTRPTFESLAADLRRRQSGSSTEAQDPPPDRRRTACGVIVRIVRRDDSSSNAQPRKLQAAWQTARPAGSSDSASRWWVKVKGNPATFVVTEKEYPDVVFLREDDHVTVEYLVEGDPGRPTPGQRIKVERVTCRTLDGGFGSSW
jgi:hypothetical protein